MSFSQTRPPTSELVELHVLYVPEEVWNFKLNTVSADLTSKFISAGFIRVSRHVTLRALREHLGDLLGEDAVADKFIFLKHIGKNLAVVKAKQETELKVKLFAPPHALHPELYLLPGVDYLEIVYSSSTPDEDPQHSWDYQIESNGSLHIPSSLHSEKWESGKNPTSLLINHTRANMENRDNLNAIRMGRNTTRDSGIPESLEDGDMDYLHNKKRQYLEVSNLEHLSNSAEDASVIFFKETIVSCQKEHHYSSQYISPPAPPLLALSVNRIQVPIFQTETSKMAEQLKQMKAERRHMERTREELVKKVRGLLEQNKLRRYQARDAWKKKYFETKKATASLEDILNKLRQDLELYYQQLLLKLEARDVRKRPNNLTHIANTKNTTIIQVTTVQHEIDQLKQKLDNTKMKLIIEIKMRKQATSDLRALRAELAQKKIQSSLILQSETPTF
uniref:Spermatosis associated 1 n=1 Tax=Pelodiscus sinensis TaxID=13735 RepID=K7GGZ6_PELSI